MLRPVASSRLALVLVVWVVTVGCSGRGVATFHLAVGWSGALPSWNGPCDSSTLDPAGLLDEPAAGRFVAHRPGVVEVGCRDGALRLEVRQPTRLVIEGPGPLRSQGTYVLSAAVEDDKGSLDIGDAPMSWTVGPPLRETDRCNHGFCAGANGVRVVADGPGKAVANVRFQSMEATAVVVISASE